MTDRMVMELYECDDLDGISQDWDVAMRALGRAMEKHHGRGAR